MTFFWNWQICGCQSLKIYLYYLIFFIYFHKLLAKMWMAVLGSSQVSPTIFTEFHQISPDFTAFHLLSQDFTEFHQRFSLNFTGLYRISQTISLDFNRLIGFHLEFHNCKNAISQVFCNQHGTPGYHIT